MANTREHALVGALCGAGVSLACYAIQKHQDPNTTFDLGTFLVHIGIGCLAGLAPDILEPATHPNHRQFFHSVATGTLVCYGAFGPPADNLPPTARATLQTGAAGYLSHLLLDSQTPKSIPLVA